MKKAKKVLLLALCAVLLVGATIAGTLAFLTDTDEVKNTFTVGNVMITLDEKDVDDDDNKDDNVTVDNVVRDKANTYHLVPGVTYEKDPTVHVQANSEDSYLFVKITSSIDAYIDTTNIENQLDQNGWNKLDGDAGVWYQSYTKTDSVKDVEVFEAFTVLNNANNVDGWNEIAPDDSKIEVVAYAIQSETFASAEAAWNAVSAEYASQG